jgi:O-antigen ligase
MRAAVYKDRWFVSPIVLPVAIIALAGLFWLGRVILQIPVADCLVLLVQLVLFCLAFRRPVWAVAALLVGQLTGGGQILYPTAGFQISTNLLWTVGTILLLIPIISRTGLDIDDKARRVIIPAIVFFSLAIISSFVNTDVANAFKYLRWTATALVIILLLPTMVKEKKDLMVIGVVAIITCFISAIGAVIQHYYDPNLFRGRSSGFLGTPIQLALNMSVLLMPVIAIVLLRGTSSRVRIFLVVVAAAMFSGIIFSFTRSGIYSIGVGIVGMAFLLKGRTRYLLLVVTLIVGVAFLSYSYAHHNRFSEGLGEQSASSRLVLWQVGVNIALDHPILGIGAYKYQEVSPAYRSTLSGSLAENQVAVAALGQIQPHDDFILVWLSFGTLAVLALICFLIRIFQNFLYSYRHAQSRFLKGLALGCVAAVIAYVCNAAVHNVMDSVFTMWILGGLSIVLARVSSSESAQEREES